jgi:hypothetical protein
MVAILEASGVLLRVVIEVGRKRREVRRTSERDRRTTTDEEVLEPPRRIVTPQQKTNEERCTLLVAKETEHTTTEEGSRCTETHQKRGNDQTRRVLPSSSHGKERTAEMRWVLPSSRWHRRRDLFRWSSWALNVNLSRSPRTQKVRGSSNLTKCGSLRTHKG